MKGGRQSFRASRGLRLVTQALLVPIGLHALLAFVFVDFRLTTLLERTHVLWFGLWLD
jgi:hypothetical protein